MVKVCSNVGSTGLWGKEFLCSECSAATSFKLRSQEETCDEDGDNTAVNNFKLICECGNKTFALEGDNRNDRGKWTEEQMCPPETGIKTQVEAPIPCKTLCSKNYLYEWYLISFD